MKKEFVDVDGSVMEGGGSIVRLTTALSILTGKPVRIYNIRKGRSQPGLRNQHLRGLEASALLCGGRVEGAKIGAPEVFFYPGKITEEHIRIPIETAGSVGLVIQSLMIACLKAKKRTTIDIEGGATFGKYAPPLQYIQFVLLPLLRRMGYHAEINIIRHGFYPAGGAAANVMIEPPKKLEPLVMERPGKVTAVDVISVASSQLKKPRVAERQARKAEAMLKKTGYELRVNTRYSDSSCPGSGVVLVARTSKGCILGADGLGERGKPAEEVAEEAVKKLLETIGSGAAVDEHMSDQLLPYMAMSSGKSVITAPALTGHAGTNMHILKQFLNLTFEVERQHSVVKITCR
jgi:RNA 3'-terminal phosphate cyclase (ATP)